MTDDDRSKREADQRTLLALALLVFAALGLLALAALVMPHLLGVILVVGGLLVFGTGHYLVWGWWLPQYLDRRDADRADNEPPKK